VNRRTYGILAGVIGLGAWWWSRQHFSAARNAGNDRGRVIFDNTPTATPLSGEGVI
jgi:hypothetical protein